MPDMPGLLVTMLMFLAGMIIGIVAGTVAGIVMMSRAAEKVFDELAATSREVFEESRYVNEFLEAAS